MYMEVVKIILGKCFVIFLIFAKVCAYEMHKGGAFNSYAV